MFTKFLSLISLATLLLFSACKPAAVRTIPESLSETGLYSDFAAKLIADDVLSFEPQYPLWSDGASKRRWIRLPAGTSIDASDPDHWVFPVGTRLWKEFAHDRRIETRYAEKLADGSWWRVAYLWNAEETEARLAPASGVRAAARSSAGTPHDVPSRADCFSCHATGDAALGFDALQLSPDRDELAPHSLSPNAADVDLADLIERGLVRDLPVPWREVAPRIDGATPRERAVLGYLHGNCGACHRDGGLLELLELRLDARLGADRSRTLDTLVGVPSRFTPPDAAPGTAVRVRPGSPESSTLFYRIASRAPETRMPPLGTHGIDHAALTLIEAWIREDLLEPSALSVSTN